MVIPFKDKCSKIIDKAMMDIIDGKQDKKLSDNFKTMGQFEVRLDFHLKVSQNLICLKHRD